jgi:hypothetical protein
MNLPLENLEPEAFVKVLNVPVEVMVVILMHGGWLIQTDWKPFVRYTIANRLRIRKTVLFDNVFFGKVADKFLDFQLNGGTFALQKELRVAALTTLRHPARTDRHVAVSRLILSTMDELEVNTLIQPFHWIRTALGLSEVSSPFGMALANSEMLRQKKTLCKLLRQS